MVQICAIITAVVALPLVFFGFGRITSSILRAKAEDSALLLPIGVAALIFIGGALNFLGLVSCWTIGLCIIVGLTAAAMDLKSSSAPSSGGPLNWATYGAVGVIVAFVVLTQFPPALFNYGDDFGKYFSHPVRMLQTGTVYGSALSAIGAETLGGQAFIQAFFVQLFPIQYVNGADAVLGLFLCLFVARASCAARPGAAVISLLSVFVIEPQYVNISSIYLSAVLVMAATMLGHKATANVALLSLIYAGLIALKPTMAIFVITHGFATIALPVGNYRQSVARLGWLVIGTFLCVLPWLLVHLPSYLKSAASHYVDGVWDKFSGSIWSFTSLPFGGSMGNYSLVIVGLAMGVFIRFSMAQERDKNFSLVAVSVAVLIIVYLLFIYGMGPLSGYQYSVRFFAPVLIGMAPALISALISNQSSPRIWLCLVPTVVALIFFLPSRFERLRSTVRNHAALPWSFIESTTYVEYNRYVLDGPAESDLRLAQSIVPVGRKLLVNVRCPFHLDFRRNDITDMDDAGLANPWARVPEVEYLLVEKLEKKRRSPETELATFGRRVPGKRERMVFARTLAMADYLESVEAKSELVYSRGSLRVYRLSTAHADNNQETRWCLSDYLTILRGPDLH